ncbi:S8 family serine peptidase [soil metagenome]
MQSRLAPRSLSLAIGICTLVAAAGTPALAQSNFGKRTRAQAPSTKAAAITSALGESPRDAWYPDEPTATGPRDGDAAPGSLLIRLDPSVTAAERARIFADAGVRTIKTAYSTVPNLFAVNVDAGSEEIVAGALRKTPGVRYVERDLYRFAMAQSTPYGIDLVKAPLVWPATRGAGVRVAVLDTGVDLTHPDLPQPIVMQSFIDGQDVQDNNNHGTHCSGTVLAIDNTIGVVGVAPQATLMTGKVLADSGSGPTSGIMTGIQWAQTNQAKVISMSLGGGGFSQAFLDVIQAAVDGGVVVVAAAGNSNSATPSYPGAYEPVVCVAAIDQNRQRASFSNFGPHIDVSAPGVSVLSSISTTTLSLSAEWNGVPHTVVKLTGSGTGFVSAQAVFCGVGNPADFPPAVSGQIAHIRRGGTDAQGNTLSFITKTQNAIAAGAQAVIISNNTTGNISGTLGVDVAIPVVGVTQAAGDELQAANPALIANVAVIAGAQQYAYFNGTSMATPHLAGVCALLEASAGTTPVTVAQIRAALQTTCEDLGTPGFDENFGFGLVNAQAARAALLASLAPPRCSPADIARDDGTPLIDTTTASTSGNSGVNEGDYNAFFNTFFTNQSVGSAADIADDAGAALPPFGAGGGSNSGVNEGDYNLFFNTFFAGC